MRKQYNPYIFARGYKRAKQHLDRYGEKNILVLMKSNHMHIYACYLRRRLSNKHKGRQREMFVGPFYIFFLCALKLILVIN